MSSSLRRVAPGAQVTFNAFADLAVPFPFEEPAKPTAGEFGLIADSVTWRLRSDRIQACSKYNQSFHWRDY
jgi:hypothetical protein